jgi:carbonic anhydrase/acetyltransferase-like protein (isoleucine patch superfamily)
MDIGDGTSIQDRSIFLGEVIVGRYCTVSLNVYMSSGRHYFELLPGELIKDQDRYALENVAHAAGRCRPVLVEDDCWLGFNVVVMPGVRLGKGAVVGANSVVTKDVAPYTVVAGAPAKFIKQRLAFSAPRQIVHSEPADWPYFYSGFAVSRAERKAHAQVGGLVVNGTAVLALDPVGGEFLCLSAKSLEKGQTLVTFGDQHAELTPDFREIGFRLADVGHLDDRLPLRAEPSSARWALERAWIR